jgi:glycosyltransferase involved in cell wall biosynthesis
VDDGSVGRSEGDTEQVIPRFPVSVVVPVRNEERTIDALLDSLEKQTRRPDEVVIVDGGSTDSSVSMIQKYIDKGYGIKLVRTEHAYPGEGRNRGIEEAGHATIALTDAGVRLDPEWLRKLCEPLERDPTVAVVYGTYEPLTNTFFEECAALAYVPARSGAEKGNIRGPSIVSALIRKRVWATVGGFPPHRASEDLVFIERVGQGGFKVAYAPDARCYWRLAPGWSTTFRRFATYSYHNLLAGRAQYWHMGVMRQYLIALPFVSLAIAGYRSWLAVPMIGLGVRVARRIWPKRTEFGIKRCCHPLRWLTVALILVLTDIATLAGSLVWLLQKAACRLHSRLLGGLEPR